MSFLARVSIVLVASALALGCGDRASSLDSRIATLFGDAPWGALNRDLARSILETGPDDDAPFYMVNLIRHRERAVYRDGRATDLSGAEADALYGSLVLPILADIGARPVFVADVERALIDGDDAAWTQVAIVLYPSRGAFVGMLERDDFRAAAPHKVAGVERTIALVAEPAADAPPDELRRVDLATVPFPPTPDDPPVTVVNLLHYNDVARYADGRATDLTGRDAMALYERARAAQAFPLGVRPGLWLSVVGELIGDGRTWDELRVNNFPSGAALAELVRAETLTAAGYEHRAAALADAYAVVAAPFVNAFGYLD